MDFLQEILEYKRAQIKKKKIVFDGLKRNIQKSKLTRYGLFRQAVSRAGKINLIAEIKKASPSRGLIRKDFDVMDLARSYVESGAAAISVLTEEKYFLGKMEYLRRVSDGFQVPVLAKDFFIDECQIHEAFNYRASAILLIVAILSDEQLKKFQNLAADLDMDCLVEIHDERELDRALQSGAEILGINNRDLHSFDVDIGTSERLIPKIPKDRVIVVESGIKTHHEVRKFQDMGASAVLIGETFLKEQDVKNKIKEVMGKGNVARDP